MPGSLRSDTPAPFVWPALTSDGCGGGTCADGSSGSDHHFPMGSRFRLGEQRCNQEWADPQAALIVEAMCTYGIVLTDSSHGFSISTERSPGPDGIVDRTADAELSTLSLRDFELVDPRRSQRWIPTPLAGGAAWAGAEYGFGSPLPGGWYSGRFWNRLLAANVAPAEPGAPIFSRPGAPCRQRPGLVQGPPAVGPILPHCALFIASARGIARVSPGTVADRPSPARHVDHAQVALRPRSSA
ncbi:MAG: hypothetical protein R2716_07145 [Microthrixaceae bacterium]